MEMMGVLIRQKKTRHRDTGRRPCEDRGRDNVSSSVVASVPLGRGMLIMGDAVHMEEGTGGYRENSAFLSILL